MNRGDLIWYVGPGKEAPRPGVIISVEESARGRYLRVIYGSTQEPPYGEPHQTIKASSKYAPRYGLRADTHFARRNIHLVKDVVQEVKGRMIESIFVSLCEFLEEPPAMASEEPQSTK